MKTATHPPLTSTSAAALITPVKTAPRPFLRLGGAVLGLLFALNATSQAAVSFWDGDTNANWNTGANWQPLAPVTNDDLVFGDFPTLFTTTFNDIPGGDTYNSVNFVGSQSFVLTGNGIAIDAGGITNDSSVLQTLSFTALGGITLLDGNGSTQVWNAASGPLLITSDVAFLAVFNPSITLIITGAYDTTITGSLSDPFLIGGVFSTLVKEGAGTLTLTGNNTYLGDTTINGGTLLVNGTNASLNTYVNPGGTLGGIGFIAGQVFNYGNVNPGNSPGTLTIGGNYHQSSSGTLTIEIAGKRSGQHDLLVVGGQAHLAGRLRLVKIGDGPKLKVGDKITFLTAARGVVGEFKKVENPFVTGTIVETEVVYRDHSVALEAVQGSFGDFASEQDLTYNQQAVARGLDKVAFRNRPPKLIEFLNEQPLEKLPGQFDEIAPDELASIYHIGMALANVQSTNLQRRTADLRSGASGFAASGYSTGAPIYRDGYESGNTSAWQGAHGPTGSEGKGSKDFVPPAENRWGAFLTGVGEWVDVDGDGNARGYDITTGGFTLGADYKFSPNFAAGLMAGYAGTGADLTNGGSVLVNGGRLGLYATYFTGGFYVDAAVMGGYNSYDTRRSALRGNARGSTDGTELNALLGTGYDWQIANLSIWPTATFQYTYLGIDGFGENGSLAPLNFNDQSADSIRTALGFKASYDWTVGGVIIKPEVRAAWQHEFGDDRYDIASGFQNGAGNLFTVAGPEIGRDSVLVGAGVAVLWNERTSTYLYYDGELGRTRYDAHNVSGGVRIAF